MCKNVKYFISLVPVKKQKYAINGKSIQKDVDCKERQFLKTEKGLIFEIPIIIFV